MDKNLFLHIVNVIGANDMYFVQKRYARPAHYVIQEKDHMGYYLVDGIYTTW